MSKTEAHGLALRPRVQLAAQDIRGEFVVVDTQTGDYHIFNEIGRLIWKGLVARKEADVIIDEIVVVYRVSRDQAGEDFKSFVSKLLGYGLLE